jgi:hypothetical protein
MQFLRSYEQLQSVMNYIQDTWFDSTVWPITAWSVFGKSVRTNNDVEGWHNRVNTHAQLEQLTVLHREYKGCHTSSVDD